MPPRGPDADAGAWRDRPRWRAAQLV